MPNSCPSRAELDSFQKGSLDDVALSSIAAHVETCSLCQRSLETLIGESADPVLFALLRESEPSLFASESGCQVAIERAMAQVETGISGGAPPPTFEIPRPFPSTAESLPLAMIREYKLLAKLGQGGMGAVYKALHTRLDKVVALKVLPEGRMRDDGSVARFQREMKAVGRLDHPNIVRAMDAGDENGTHFLVMEYVEGMDLSELIKNIGPLSVPDACELIRQAAIGLQEAHEHGMVHRDIKPSNLILAKPARKKHPPTLKILDLGLALLAGDAAADGPELTSTGQMMGTVDYMAPEQGSSSHQVDIRADIYSLGATLYKLLTGVAPFGDAKYDTPVKKILAIAAQAPPPVQSRRSDIPPPLVAIVHKLLAKDPGERYGTPGELANALLPHCAGADLAALVESNRRGDPPVQPPEQSETQPSLKSASVDTVLPQGLKPDDSPTVAFRPSAARRLPTWVWPVATGVGSVTIVMLGIILFWQTPQGTVRIEINDKDIVATFEDGGMTLERDGKDAILLKVDAKGDKTIPSGEHWLTIRRGKDFEFKTKSFMLANKGETILKIELLEGEVIVTHNGNQIGEKPLPIASAPSDNNKPLVNAAPVHASYALRFEGDGEEPDLSSVLLHHGNSWTVEGWVTPRETLPKDGEASLVLMVDPVWIAVRNRHPGPKWSMGGPTSRPFPTIFSSDKAEAGKATHVAMTKGPRGVTFYVNGKQQGEPMPIVFLAGESRLRIALRGNPARRDVPFFGDVDEVRVSSGERYKENFTPKARFEPDADTMALFHFDEGQREEVKDSSGRNKHGKLGGAKWMKAVDVASERHGWPKDAPVPALAPFDEKQAKSHQREWADYLGVPVEYENSIGMKFVLIPPGEFMMGSTKSEIDDALRMTGDDIHLQACIKRESPRHKVILSQPIYLGIHEITQAQFKKVMEQNPSHFAPMGVGKDAVLERDTDEHPVESINWTDAIDFCAKLSEREKLRPFYSRSGEEVTMMVGNGYRLPTEAEWEFSCRAGTTTRYWNGDRDDDLIQVGWCNVNSGDRTHAIGELKSNPFDLYDMHGNVWEWVEDWWEPAAEDREKLKLDWRGPAFAGLQRGIRGGGWNLPASLCRSALRGAQPPSIRHLGFGFRVALSVDAVRMANPKQNTQPSTAAADWQGWPKQAPSPATAPFDAQQAKQHRETWANYLNLPQEHENSLGMKFILIPPGEFQMGSTAEEIEAALKVPEENELRPKGIKSEGPRHKVILTQPIYLGIHEVTQSDYEQVMGTNPSQFSAGGEKKNAMKGIDSSKHPVENVSWNDAVEFCAKLSQREKLQPCYEREGETVTFLKGNGYRLPTEAQWEFACRAGTMTKFWTGDDDETLAGVGWLGSSGGRTHPVGERPANPFGLHDIHGNVWEWVQDRWSASYYELWTQRPAIDPAGPGSENPTTTGSMRLVRGGSWGGPPSHARSASRETPFQDTRFGSVGFRVALPVEAVKATITLNEAEPMAEDREANGTVFPAYRTEPLHLVKQKDEFATVRAELELLQKSSKQNYHVVILPTLGDYAPRAADYLRTLAAEWEQRATQQKKSFNSERLVIIVMAVNDQQLQIFFGPQLKDGLGLDGPPVTKELLVPHFLAYARKGEFTEGLVALLRGTEKLIAEREAAKRAEKK